MNVDFKEIKDYFYNNRYRDNTTRKYAGMFEKVSQIIDENDILYFPIVIARKEISVYAAKLINSKCEIKKDELILLG